MTTRTTTVAPTATSSLSGDVPPGIRDASRRTIENPIAGEVGTVLKYSYETNGEYGEAVATCAPGGGPPLHYHRSYTERFESLEGDLIMYVGKDEPVHLKPGEMMEVPKGVHHKFSAGPDGAKFKCRVTPGQPGFEKSLYILFGLARDGLVNEKTCLPKSLVHTAIIGSLGDMCFPGPGGALINGLTAGMAAYGKWSGIEEELIKKYWES